MKITDQTTLAELEIERAKLGVSATIIELDRDGQGTIAHVYGQVRAVLGRGPTIATAIDDAFTQLRMHIARGMIRPVDGDGGTVVVVAREITGNPTIEAKNGLVILETGVMRIPDKER